jgi:hypothetical protein
MGSYRSQYRSMERAVGKLSGKFLWLQHLVSAENGSVFAECYGGGLLMWDAATSIKANCRVRAIPGPTTL